MAKRFLDEIESAKFSSQKRKNHDGNTCGKQKLREISALRKETRRIPERKRTKGDACIFRRVESTEENLCALPPDPKLPATTMENMLRMTGRLKRAVHREFTSQSCCKFAEKGTLLHKEADGLPTTRAEKGSGKGFCRPNEGREHLGSVFQEIEQSKFKSIVWKDTEFSWDQFCVHYTKSAPHFSKIRERNVCRWV